MHKENRSTRRYISAISMVLLFFSSMIVAAAYSIEGSADNEEIVREKVYESSDEVNETLNVIEEPAFADDVNDEEDMITQEIEEDILKVEQETVEEIETFSIENNSTNINLVSNVSSFQELQDAIKYAEEDTVITVVNDIEFEEAIVIENGVNITIHSDPNNMSILKQQNSDKRHFLVSGDSTLAIENIILRGNRDENNAEIDSVKSGGVVVAGEGTTLIMNGTAYIQLCNAARGGAVELKDGAAFTMNGGTISQSRAANGGGLYLGNDTSFTMKNGLISGNLADDNGGGLYLVGNSVFVVESGIINGNIANYGAGVYLADTSSFTMESGTISGNKAIHSGGGIYVSSKSRMDIAGTISTNFATWGIGGGIYTEDFNNLITDNSTVFEFNQSTTQAASPFQGRANDFPNIRFDRVSVGGFDHPINNWDINNDLDLNSMIRRNVTINYVGLDGKRIIGLDGEQVEPVIHSVINESKFNIEEKLTTIDGFMALHFVVEDDDEQHDLRNILEITEDMTITVYHASTIMTITIPDETKFYANEATGGAIVSETYDIINESELPVKVIFKELTPIYMDSINLVPEATNINDLHLNIDFSGGVNNRINNIIPNHEYNVEMGVLGGAFIGGSDSKGSFSISGQYIGNITDNPKRPQVEFMFSFELDKRRPNK